MLLRIEQECLGETTVVHVVGRLVGAGVEELRRVCTASPRPLRIDLAELLQADEMGLALLRALRDSGAELMAVSPFIALLLRPDREKANVK